MRVLIVDDIALNRRLLRAVLEAENLEVLEADDGLDALAVLEKETVDAIISDILMPRMDGYRLCYEIRTSERLQHLPFLFYTSSYTSPSDEKLAFEMGADKFLTKPAATAVLLRALEEAMTMHRDRAVPSEPARELNLMKEYNQQLVAKLEQKNSELTTRNAELVLLGTALETAANGVMITDTAGTILWVNPAFTTLTGYDSDEVIGQNPRMLKSGVQDAEFYRELWSTVLAGGTWRGSFANRRKDGSIYLDEHTITPVRSDEGEITHFISIMNDVTERRHNEEALKLFRALIDQSTDAIEVIDPETGGFLDVNERAHQRLGYTREEMLRLGIPDVEAVAVTQEGLLHHIAEIRSEGSKILEGRHRRKDGTTFPIEINVRYIRQNRDYLVAVVRDITDRKKAEQQIKEQAEFLDKARDAILVRDLEGHVLYWNQGAERMYGWKSEEVVGRNVVSFLYSNPEKFYGPNQESITNGEWHGELQHLTRERGEITIEGRWTLIRDDEGRPKSVLAINTDVTEKKKIEAQFLRAQRMESIGTLAGGIAHDLNNILAPIMMSIDVLKAISSEGQAMEILETIEVSAKRGADIVRQVLSFARGLEGERVEIQPTHLVKDIGKIIKDTFPKDIRLQFHVPHDTWTILGDPTQMHQVLLNLCVNSRDAMPGGGVLGIDVENCELDAQYAAMNIQAKPGRYVKISVTDSGTGIPPALLDKIFEPFFTTKEINKGTGLGLSTVLAVVKSHEGIINVYSEPGKGTTFNVYLPALDRFGEGIDGQSEERNLPRGRGETILVVDDEASILNITGQTLKAYGYFVLEATDGAEAVAKYAEYKKEIAVVLTDMMMPVMDGPATIHAITRINPNVKIISASGLSTNIDAAQNAGDTVKHFLTKPYTAGTLLRVVRNVLDEP